MISLDCTMYMKCFKWPKTCETTGTARQEAESGMLMRSDGSCEKSGPLNC